MDIIYYGTFALLLFQCGFGGVIAVLTLFQIISLLRKGIPEQVSVLFVFLQLPLALLNLLVSLYFLSLLRGQILEPVYIWVLTALFGTAETFASRYFRKRQIVNPAN